MEDLVYRRLLDLYYDGEKPLEGDYEKLGKKIGMRDFYCEIQDVLNDFFIFDGESWKHEKADKEIAVYHSKANVARANGKKGGRPKKTQSEPNPNPEITQPVNLANPDITPLQANQEPLTNNHKPTTNNQLKTKAKTWEPPTGLNLDAWEEFEQHRKDIKKPMTNTARSKAANQIIGLSHAEQQSTIDKSIASRWAGLFPDKITASSEQAKKDAEREQGAQDWANGIETNKNTYGEVFEHGQF